MFLTILKIDDVVILIGAGFAVRLPKEVRFIKNENDSIDLALVQLKGERIRALKSKIRAIMLNVKPNSTLYFEGGQKS